MSGIWFDMAPRTNTKKPYVQNPLRQCEVHAQNIQNSHPWLVSCLITPSHHISGLNEQPGERRRRHECGCIIVPVGGIHLWMLCVEELAQLVQRAEGTGGETCILFLTSGFCGEGEGRGMVDIFSGMDVFICCCCCCWCCWWWWISEYNGFWWFLILGELGFTSRAMGDAYAELVATFLPRCIMDT